MQPVYNGARYLGAALDSARAQNHAALQTLLVDDGSSDKSMDIAMAASTVDPRVHCMRNPVNLGLVGNWNRCVELAQGGWIKSLFQDGLRCAPTRGCLRMLYSRLRRVLASAPSSAARHA